MARRKEQDLDRRPPRRRVKRWKIWGAIFLTGCALFVVFLPQIVTSRSILNGLVNRYAGIAPLTVDLEQVKAGWMTPVSATGIQLKDAGGQVLARIGKVSTQKGLIGWITNSTDLGTIEVDGLEAAIVANQGTTNIEAAIAHLLATAPDVPPAEASSMSQTTGTVRIKDAKFLIAEAGRPEQWVVQIPTLSATLPTGNQFIGPIEAQANIGEASGTVVDSVGTIAANVKQVGEAFEVEAQLQHLPVDLWHVVHARFPDIPIDELQGRVSGRLFGKLVDTEHWSFDLQQVETRELAITAPDIVGKDTARLASVSATGRASLAGTSMIIEGVQLACDFGVVNAAADIPWPIPIPTAANPFLEGASIRAEGTVDLPKLIFAARSLIPVRADTQVLSGTAQFLVSQNMNKQGAPTSQANLTLAGLRANAAGQELTWNDPLTVSLSADKQVSGLRFGAEATAEFCSVKGGGTIEAGQIQGNVNLDVLQRRLSQWIELPIRNMNGSVDLEVVWNMAEVDVVEAQGRLNTSPLMITTNTGGEIQEPAWTGTFSATTRLAQGSPSQIDRAKFELTAQDEKLTVDLQEPLAIAGPIEGAATLPPAAFNITLVGDLAGWKRRGLVWLSEPPELELAGNINLALGGRIDLNHVEIQQANWRSKPMHISTPSMKFHEAEMVGNFKGRVDTANLTRLRVDALQVQATSFSLGAKDEATADGSGRIGQAMFLVDLNNLLSSMSSLDAPPAQNAQATEPVTEVSATGRVQGQMQWQVNSTAAGFALAATGENVVVLSKPPGSIAPTPLWDEPTITTKFSGQWTAETGAVDIDSLQLEMPWFNYSGNAAYHSQELQQQIVAKGEAVVDTTQLSTKLASMTGNQVQLYGKQTVPVDVQWTSASDPRTSMLAGLQAVTRIGWEQARVAGIDVGAADVPVTIAAGQLATKAEIPVSGGMLRWDVTSDLTAQELVIHQAPMTVLENVAITPEMCKGWLKYVTPLIAEATSVDGRLSLVLNDANLTPANPRKQTVVGQLVMHSAEVGPGPLSNQIISMVKQIDAIRKKDFTQAVSTQKVWLKMPEQRIDFQMVDGRVFHRNLNIRVGDVNMTTSGSVSVDGQMDMMAAMPIPDDWIEKSPLLVGLRGQSLQFPMRGTLKAPQIDGESIRQLGRQAVQGAAQGLLEKGLSRGFEKIFGAPPPVQPIQPQQ
ncbi:MAG: hypothetical protein R3C53_03255 [Pirellulaceae bacterium]